ncbi:MAG: glycine cleavage system aminomethyltransferase GcvT [Coraliomargaritaceae bacterium]
MDNPRKLPLHPFHQAHGARFVPFGGWEMPVQYSSIIEEHKAVRNTAGLFDVSHMGEVRVTGADAADFLDRLLTNSIASAANGRAIYSPMCYEDGGVVDDLIVYRIDDEEFLVCVNAANQAKDLEWMHSKAKEWGTTATVRDESDAFALLALQGPKAAIILEASGLSGITELGRFRHECCSLESGVSIRICRTGYTGEDGFELFLGVDDADVVATRLMKEGAKEGLQLCGLGARDSLRLEAGLPLYGHELSETITPLEAGFDWTVKLNKPDFVGKVALLAQAENGPDRRVVHFKLTGRRIAREGTSVVDAAGEAIGTVLSGTHSPILGCPIGSALVKAAALKGDLSVDLRGHKEALTLVQIPMHRK